MSVLRVLDSKNLTKHIKNLICSFKSCIFSENPCAKMKKIRHGSPNPLFYRCKFSPRLQIRLLFRKTRTKLAASEGDWRLRSSPIVENKTVVSLCKFKSVLISTWFQNSREKCIQYMFPVVKNLHKKTFCSFSTIGDDGSRQSRSYAAILAAVLRKSNLICNRWENLQR